MFFFYLGRFRKNFFFFFFFFLKRFFRNGVGMGPCFRVRDVLDLIKTCFCGCSCTGTGGSVGFQPLLRPLSTTSLSPATCMSSSSPSPSLMLSRPTSVLGDKEILYAQLDLTPSATPFVPEESEGAAGSPRLNDAGDAAGSSSSSTGASGSSSTTYAQIDFQKSDGLKSVLSGSR